MKNLKARAKELAHQTTDYSRQAVQVSSTDREQNRILQRIAIKRATDKTTKTNTGLCFRIHFCGGFNQKLL